MATLIFERQVKTLAQVLHDLGDISPERIRFPVGNATEQDLIDALDGNNKRLYELIDGVLVEKAMGMGESIIAMIIGRYLGNFLDRFDLGIVFGADGPIRLKPGRIRMPDVGFVSWERLPGQDYPEDAILDAIPDLAVEVISESNTSKEMELKLNDYFKAGVRLVWFIYPKTQTAQVFTSPTSKKEIAKDENLEGGKVLPGFSMPLKKLFPRRKRRLNGKK